MLITILLALWLQVGADRPCEGVPTAPRLDHVVLGVRDLDAAAAGFANSGFRIKLGRLHANNLLNRHIKFRDGSSIELMTVQGTPGDAMAQRYVDLIAAREGGVYVALTIDDLASAERAAAAAGLRTRRSSSGPWQFLGFEDAAPAPLFFSTGGSPANDPESLVSHVPDVRGLAEAWVTAGPELKDLLTRLGARSCGPANSPDGDRGERLALGRGWLVIVPPRPGAPRMRGVVLQSETAGERVIRPHPAFWIAYRDLR